MNNLNKLYSFMFGFQYKSFDSIDNINIDEIKNIFNTDSYRKTKIIDIEHYIFPIEPIETHNILFTSASAIGFFSQKINYNKKEIENIIDKYHNKMKDFMLINNLESYHNPYLNISFVSTEEVNNYFKKNKKAIMSTLNFSDLFYADIRNMKNEEAYILSFNLACNDDTKIFDLNDKKFFLNGIEEIFKNLGDLNEQL